MELVETAQVVQQGLQGLLDLGQLQEPVDHDVKHRDEPEADVAEVGREGLEMLFLCQSVGRELLRELSVELEVFLVPVLQQVVVGRHDPAELVHSEQQGVII